MTFVLRFFLVLAISAIVMEIKSNGYNRTICDFLSSMTNKYAVEFYGRLKSEFPVSYFKP